MAGNEVEIIFHLAAIKNIEISEFNPIETIDTNINGAVNIIKMCIKNKPKIFFNISTDKASNPSTLYGTTKQLSERLTSWAGISIDHTNFTSIRLGNVMETRGNVFEVWKEELKKGEPLSITHQSMKRYFIHVDEAVNFILQCLPIAKTGETLVPKMKEYKISQLANEISKKHKIIGLRQGEKMEETLPLIAGALMTGMGAIGGAIGVGVAASKYLEGIARQPELQAYLLGQFFIMMALIDALPIISLAFGLIQLFG
jgi:UDP-N-acetylglucosamine 4,6-dehydratase